jgi:hypothetical protein
MVTKMIVKVWLDYIIREKRWYKLVVALISISILFPILFFVFGDRMEELSGKKSLYSFVPYIAL